MKILLIEDDLELVGPLVSSLKEHGLSVDHVPSLEETGRGGAESSERVDLVILARMQRVQDFKDWLSRARRKWSWAKILVISETDKPLVRAEFLDLGADDCIGKPFLMQELAARIRALLRRSSEGTGSHIRVGNLVIDPVTRLMSVGEAFEALSAKEFMLLRALSRTPKHIWSKNELLLYVWGQTTNIDTNVVEATITNIRKKLKALGSTAIIRNARNIGYWIEE